MSDTPRTDESIRAVSCGTKPNQSWGVIDALVQVSFARQLERELAVYQEQEQKFLATISDLDSQLKSVSDQLAIAQESHKGALRRILADCNESDEFVDKNDIKVYVMELLKGGSDD